MKFNISTVKMIAAGTLALAGMGFAATAQAGGVIWNIHVNLPDVQVGVSHLPQVVIHPGPVMVPSRPVHRSEPQVVHVYEPRHSHRGWVHPRHRVVYHHNESNHDQHRSPRDRHYNGNAYPNRHDNDRRDYR